MKPPSVAPPEAPLMSLVLDHTASGNGASLGPAAVDVGELFDGVGRAERAAGSGDDVAVGAALAPVLERFRPPLEDLGESRFIAEARRSLLEIARWMRAATGSKSSTRTWLCATT